jgi:hypothetical protein
MQVSGRYVPAYLCTHRNTHSFCLDIADDRRAAFSIILVGNQIADSARLPDVLVRQMIAYR